MSDTVPCFPSNPDITGIGVRVAVYAQDLLSFVPAFFALYDKQVTHSELETIENQSTTILITGLAILVSTIVQTFSASDGLTNLHAVVILNLSWMNNTNLFIYFLLYVYNRLTVPKKESDGSHLAGRSLSVWKKEVTKALHNDVFYYGTVHLTLMAAVGIWLWHRPLSFGDSGSCSQSAFITVLGHQVSFTSKGLKGWSLFIYSLLLVPGLNLVIPAIFLAPLFFYSFTPNSSPDKAYGLKSTSWGLAVLAIINILFLVDTEVMLQKNSHLVAKGDAEWTFGQTLALLLLLAPLRDIAETILERQPKRLQRRLLKALRDGKLEVVEYLLDLGANPKMEGNKDWMALEKAASNGHLEVVKQLIKTGADVNAKNSFGWTALMSAASNGRLEVVKQLIETKAKVNAKNESGLTALMSAASNGRLEVIKQLIEAQADVNVKSNDGWTALMFAARKEHLDVIKQLSEYKADVNAKDKKGRTVLMYAAEKGHLEVVEQLIEAQADVNVKDNNGKTALERAHKFGHRDVVGVLKEHGAV